VIGDMKINSNEERSSRTLEKIFEESGRILSNVIENFTDGIFVLEKNWDLLFLNKNAGKIMGFEPQSIIGRNFWELLPELKGTHVERYFLLAMNSQEIKRFEISLFVGECWFEVTVYPSRDCIIAHWHDISKRKKAEEALKESERSHRTLVETSTDGIVVHRDGRFLFANNAALRLFGVSSFSELRKYAICDFIPKSCQTSVATRVVTEAAGKVLPKEEGVISLNGERFFVEGTSARIHYMGGRAILIILHDVTQRKEMQLSLEKQTKNLEKIVNERTMKVKESEQRYRELYESFDEAFIAVDWELNVIHWNKAAERITTVSIKEALGKKLYDVMPEMASVNIEAPISLLQEGKSARFTVQTKSRQTHRDSIFEISTYPSKQGIVAIVEDKTEEEKTKRLSIIGQTAGMVGHDLRNPLQSVIGEVYLAKSEIDLLSESPQKDCLLESIKTIEEQANYMDKIVADLQAFVKPTKVLKKPVEIKSLVLSILREISYPKKIKINLQFPASLPIVNGDPQLLKRVLINLVTNAWQAMPDGGELAIKAEADQQELRLSVEDTGLGIPDSIKPQIFTPLFTTKSRGQGFGLAVCKRVIEAHDGTISFESQEGKGSKFIIQLPLE
jgi:PAS domain S-box-containing protein